MTNLTSTTHDLNTLTHQLINEDGIIKTTSFEVALYFGKNHRHVMRDIKNLPLPDAFKACNFGLCHKNNDLQNGKPQPYYKITKNGFMLLCMGYTGHKAMSKKLLFLEAFDTLIAQVQNQQVELLNLRNQTLRLEAALLDANPTLKAMVRYKRLALNHVEIGKLMGLNVSTVRKQVRKLEDLGILNPPGNLAQLQAMSARLMLHSAEKG